MKKVLVTGGAGYIGSTLVQLLLDKGYFVRVLDNLSFGGEAIVDLFNNPNFEFIKGDIRDVEIQRRAIQGMDAVAHLAGIVGDPACAIDKDLTNAVNLEASYDTYRLSEEMGVKRFVFASTCSTYGKMADPEAFLTETGDLSPVSLYAETKVQFEQFLVEQPRTNVCKPVRLRFSTVYGLSRRPRFDLTVNEFTKELALKRELVIFGEQFWRPYCHVLDLARSIVFAIEAEESKVAWDVFNVGSTNENYTKQMLVNEIVKVIPDAVIKYVKRDEDPRDYRVNCDKIEKVLGFKIQMTVPDGIKQIKQSVEEGFFNNPDDSKYKNI